MLDIHFIREHKDLIAAAAKKKHLSFNVDELIAADEKRRTLLISIEKKRATQNEYSGRMANLNDGADRLHLLADLKELKEGLQKEEEEFKGIMREWQKLMLAVPNIPDVSVPEGVDESANQTVKQWGVRPTFSFPPKNHVELLSSLGLLDLDRGAAVSGFRGYFLKGDAVQLLFSLWQFTLDFYRKREGFELMITPALVRRETLLGSAYLPQGEEDLYHTQDSAYLSGTAEVPVMGYFADRIFSEGELPKKILAFSPCFRREAGSYGKDNRGIFRVHEFFKFEQVVLCEANHETSVRHHEEINRNMEELVQALGISYRTVINYGGDLGLGQVKKYDVELWIPSEGRYREIGSASYFHDFQCRRLNIKYRSGEKTIFAHSLNATALPTPRFLIAMVENNQRADGSIHVPEALRSSLGKPLIQKGD